MIIKMSQDSNSVWRYEDQCDAVLCTLVGWHGGWELTSLDSWLNEDSHWVDRPNDRSMLIRLRRRLAGHVNAKPFRNDLFKARSDALYFAAEAVSQNVAGCRLELKDMGRKKQSTDAAGSDRPNARSQLRGAIVEAMRPSKREQRTFKSFIEAWLSSPISDLRLTEIEPRKKYEVTEDFCSLGPKPYTWSTLEKMYSETA